MKYQVAFQSVPLPLQDLVRQTQPQWLVLWSEQFNTDLIEFTQTTHQATSDLVRSYKMDNVTFIEINGETHAIIDRGNGEFTSMPKSVYDEMIANQTSLEV